MTSEGATQALVRHACAIRYDDLPDETRKVARHCMLDFIGAALAGASEPLVDILVREVVVPERSAEAKLLGRSERATKATAALVNGAAGHALDYDDTHTVMGHPTAPVLPALLALAESRDADGRAFLAAFVAGVELECRLGSLMGPAHYAAGFHSTATLGAFGAAAACAHLLQLGEEEWRNALGLAGTQAAGLKSGFGTMAKPLHAGRAASTGLQSALLAGGGFTAQQAIVEVAQGFAATHAGKDASEERIQRHHGQWMIRDTLFKYHVACYLTHAAIDATAALRTENELRAGDVDSIEIRVHPSLFAVCNIPSPTTGLEGKFSLRATTALSLLGAATDDPATFSEERMADPELVALRDRIDVVGDDSLRGTQSVVTIQAGGDRLEGSSDSGIPAADLAAQEERLRRKFHLLARPVRGDRAADDAEAILSIDDGGAVASLAVGGNP